MHTRISCMELALWSFAAFFWSAGFHARVHAADASAPTSWHTYQGQREHDGFVALEVDPAVIAERWTMTFPADVEPSPATGGDGYVLFSVGKLLYVLGSDTGKELWIKSFSERNYLCPPAYADGRVYVQTGGSVENSFLWAYDLATHAPVFQSPYGNQWSEYYAPTIDGARVYVGGGPMGGMHAFDADVGTLLWSFALDLYDRFTPAVDDLYAFVYTGGNSSTLTVVDKVTGTLAMSIADPDCRLSGRSMDHAPVIGSSHNVLAINDGRLISFDLRRQDIGWQITEEFVGQPSLAKGVIYAANGGRLDARSEATGARLWAWEAPDGPVRTSMLVTENLVFVCTGERTYAIELATHAPVWSCDKAGSLSFIDGALVIAGASVITAIDIEGDTDGDGLPEWWERWYGGHVAADADGDGLTALEELRHATDPTKRDSDGDGLSDGEEALQHGTDPNDRDGDKDELSDAEEVTTYGTDPRAFDTDGDELSDGMEVAHGLDPRDPADAAADADGDGCDNRLEVRAGTNPHDGASFPVVSDWGMLQGNPRHDGYQPVVLDAAVFAPRWHVQLGTSISNVATGGRMVFAVSGQNLVALDAWTGKEKWVRTLNVTTSISAPSFAGELVYLHMGAASDAGIWALRGDTGELVFQGVHGSQVWNYSAPTIFEGRVYMNGGGGVEAFDALAGTHLWRSRADQADNWEPAVDAGHVLAIEKGGIKALDLGTGAELFVIDASAATQTPILGSRGNVITAGGTLSSFDIATRKAVWQTAAVGGYFAATAVGNGVVFCIQDGALIALSEANGARLWQWKPDDGILGYDIVVTASHVFVGNSAVTYAVDLKTHRAVWRHEPGGALALGSDGALIIAGNYCGTVTAIDVEGDKDGDGLPEWWERWYGGNVDADTDADGDGLSARAEYEHETDAAKPDSDGDGLSDGAEVTQYGSDPLDPDGDKDGLSDGDEVNVHGTDPRAFDTDGDGMDDGLEVAYGLDPRNAADAAADSDGDGYGNRHEILAGTDHRDAASFPVVSDWGMVQGDPGHRGYRPLLLDAANFAVRWTIAREQEVSGAAVGSGMVFVGNGLKIAALDAGTGAEKWVCAPNSFYTIYAVGFVNDLVYLHGTAETGAGLWAFRKDTGAQVFQGSHGQQRGAYNAPTIFEGRAYMNGGWGGGVEVFDALTGVRLWNSTGDWGGLWYEPAVDEDHVFVMQNGDLRVLERTTGTLRFVIDANAWPQTPVLGSRGNVIMGGASLRSFDIATQKTAWETAVVGSNFEAPAVGNGLVFSLKDGGLAAVDEERGTLLWQWRPDGDALSSNIVVTVSHVFVGSTKATYAVDLATHQAVWSCAQAGTLSLGREGALIIAGGTMVTAIEVEGDTDGDGMPQWWERRYGGDLDASADTDGDGLTAREEYEYGTDPTNADSDGDGLADGAEVKTHGTNPNERDSDRDGLSDRDEVVVHGTNPVAFDTDGDGLDDGIEVAHGFDPVDAADAAEDFDGDTYDNRHELLAGTDPRDGASFPIVSDWAMAQGNPGHSGYQPLMLDTANFAVRWTVARGETYSNAATGDGKVFVIDGKRLVALEGHTGAEIWARDLTGAHSVSAPSFANDLVYVHLGARDATGIRAFRKDTGAQVFRGLHSAQWPRYGAPTIFGDRAYVNGGNTGGVQALHALNGANVWNARADVADYWEPAVDAERVLAILDGTIRALDPSTGAELFTVGTNVSTQTPVLGSRANVLTGGASLRSFDLATRKAVWELSMAGSSFGMPAVGNGVVFSLHGGSLIAVREATGELLWQWRPVGEVLSSNIVVTASHVFAGSATTTYALDLRTRLPAWSLAQGGTLALGNDGALIIAGSTAVTAIEVEGDPDADGLPEWWERRYGRHLEPAADADGDALTALEEYAHGTEPTKSDSDGDGLADGAEVKEFATSPNDADSDKDGLSDGDEVAVYGSDPAAFDTDGDRLDDGMEAAQGLDPRDAADGAADFDGDTYDNRHEALAGTDLRDGASFPVVSDWCMVQATPDHRGYQPLVLDPANFAVRWKAARESDVAGVAAGDDTVFVANGSAVAALDAATGTERWQRTLRNGATACAPSLAGELVYFRSYPEGDFLAVRKDTGERILRGTHTAGGLHFGAPTIFEGRAYVYGDGDVTAFDAATGVSLWSSQADRGSLWEPAVDAERVLAVRNGDLRALDPLTGAELFTIDTNLTPQTPVLGTRGNVLTGGASLRSFDLATRQVVWETPAVGGDFRLPAVGHGVVYSVQAGGLAAVSEASGARLWQWWPPAEDLAMNVVVTASHVFVGSATATYALDVRTHAVVWSIPEGGPINLGNTQRLALSADGLLLIAGGTTVTAVDVQGDPDADGLPEWWERRYGGHIDSAADADGDGLTALEEYAYGTDPTKNDSDGDGLADGDEVKEHATNPNDPDSDKDGLTDGDEVAVYGTDPTAFDTDGDGLDDGTEAAHGLDPRDASDGAADPDGDSFDTRYEIIAGTDPRDGASFPVLSDWAMLQGDPGHRGYQPLVLDPANFAVRWSVTNAGTVSSMATGGGKVYFTSGRNLAALDAKTGTQKWLRALNFSSGLSAPSFANDLVYIHVGILFFAFRQDTGAPVFWGARGTATSSSYSAPTIFGDRAYMNTNNNSRVEAFNALTGEYLWRASAGSGSYWEPAVDAERVYVVRNGGVQALDRATGAGLFGFGASLPEQTPVLGSRANVCTSGAKLTSFDLATRAPAWEVKAAGGNFLMPAIGNGVVYCVQGGGLAALDEATGERLWQWWPDLGNLNSNVVATASHVFVGNATATYAIDVRTHAMVWSCAQGGSLAIGKEGALFIAGGAVLTSIDVEGDADGDGLPEWWERRDNGNLDASADADGDGLTTLREYAHHTDPTNGDGDGDGLSDGAEALEHGTDPNDPDTDEDGLSDAEEVTVCGNDPTAFDTDGDGMDDGMEAAHGLDPRDAADAVADPDGDGYANRQEIFAGTDPRDGASFPAATDWCMVQGDASHRGYQPFLVDPAGFLLRWKIRRDEGVSSVAVGDGKVFVLVGRKLVALDAATATELWVRPLGATGVLSAPSFGNDLVYVHVSGEGTTRALCAYRKDTGEEVFLGPHGNQGQKFGAPTIFEDRAYVNGAGGVQALSALTGATLWRSTADWGNYWEPAVDGERVLAVRNGDLQALERTTGADLFAIAADTTAQTPVLGSRGNVILGGANLKSCDLAAREAVWEVPAVGAVFQTPAVGNGAVYCLQGGALVAVSEANGARLWQWRPQTGAKELSSNIVVTASHVFVADTTTTYAIDVLTHQLAWSYAQGGTLAVGSDGMLVIAGGAILTAIDLEGDTDGDGLPQWWERRYGGDLDPGADLDDDGLTTLGEFEYATDPTKSDTDGDGLADGAEVTAHGTDPNDPDGDKDGLSDGDEVLVHGSDPRKVDADEDGLEDGVEVAHGLDPRDAADALADLDGDGYGNRHEIHAGTDPRAAASFPVVTDWGMLQGNPRHDGYQPMLMDAAGFKLRWEVPAKAKFSRVATGDGKVFVVDGLDLVALDGGTGERQWTRTLGVPYSISAPSFGNDLVYVHTGGSQDDTAFWAFRKDTGEQVFRTAHPSRYAYYAAPTIFGDRAYMSGGGSGGLEAMHALTGAGLWRCSVQQDANETEPAVDDAQVLWISGGDVRAMDPSTGAELFAIEGSLPVQTPVLGSLGNVFTGGTSLINFDLATRKAVWELSIKGGYVKPPAVGNGFVYSIQDGGLVVVSESNGASRWQWLPSMKDLGSNIVVTASHVFVGGESRTYALDVLTHAMVWSYDRSGALALGADGALLIMDGTTLTAIDIEGDPDGDGLPQWWERRYGGDLEAGADTDGDGLTASEEYAHATDPTREDTDGDGLSDGVEVKDYGTNPIATDSDEDELSDADEVLVYGSNPNAFDTDGDGMGDAMEIEHGLDPSNASDALTDLDGDGYSNRHEVFAGTDINDKASFPVASDWGMLQGNARHDGYQPLLLDTADFLLRWRVTRDDGVTGVATGDGKVFITSMGNLVAYDQVSGVQKWTRDLGVTGTVSPPSFANELVYVHTGGDTQTYFMGFRKDTGVRVFRVAHESQWPFYRAPTIFGNRAFMNGGMSGGIAAFNALTGTSTWRTDAVDEEDYWEPAVQQGRVLATLDGDVRVLNPLTGAALFTIDANVPPQTLVLGSRENVLASGANGLSVTSFDLATRQLLWEMPAAGTTAGIPAVGNGVVFSVQGGDLYALNEANGAALWQWQPLAEDLNGSLVVTASHVFAASGTATYAIDVLTHRQAWSYTQGGTLALSKEGVLFIADGTTVTAVEAMRERTKFRRGDANADGRVDVGDAISMLNFLFKQGPASCVSALDANDDGAVDTSDAVYVLYYLFLHAPPPRPPFPTCAVEWTRDALPCESYAPCAGGR